MELEFEVIDSLDEYEPEPVSLDFSGFMELRRWTEIHSDLQKSRIRLYNQLGLKADGTPTKERPNAIRLDESKYEPLIQHARFQEEQAQKLLVDCYRTVAPHEIQIWQKESKGIGEHSVAKLLGYIGHPRIAFPFVWEEDESGKRAAEPTPLPPFKRTVGALWAYCGVGAPLKRTRGMSKEDALRLGNPRAKTALWLMVQGIIKQGSGGKYRTLYDTIKSDQVWRLTDLGWSQGHLNNHAIRLVMKEILRDMWVISEV